MGSFRGEETPGDLRAETARATDADRALLLAAAAWGDRCEGQTGTSRPAATVADFLDRFRDRLAEGWFQTLRGALDQEAAISALSDAARAKDELRVIHAATARVDLEAVHPSWLVRALREESPAVQRMVIASVPTFLRNQMQAGLLLDSQDLTSERPAAGEVASWVMALWTERLVGGEGERADDPPAIIVLGRLSPRAGYRLCEMAGRCKLILAGQPCDRDDSVGEHGRHEWLTRRLTGADPDLQNRAISDANAIRPLKLRTRRQAARIGLTTVARLLAASQAFRVRWALQRWPYPIAKLIRSLMPPAPGQSVALLESETWILKTAWERLNLEGRLSLGWPEPKRRDDKLVSTGR